MYGMRLPSFNYGAPTVMNDYNNQVHAQQANALQAQALVAAQNNNQYAPQFDAQALQKAQILNQYLPQQAQASVQGANLRNQQTQQAINNPLLRAQGAAGQVGAMMWLQGHPSVTQNTAPIGNALQAARGQVQLVPPNSYPLTNGSSSPANPNANNLPLQPAQMNALAANQMRYADMAKAFSSQPSMGANGLNLSVNGYAGNGAAPNGALPPTVSNNPYINDIQSAMSATTGRNNYYAQRTKGMAYLTLPVGVKNYMLAQASALGIPQDVAAQQFLQGSTIQDLANQKGVPMSDVGTNFVPTEKNISQMQNRMQAMQEMNSIQPWMTQSMAPYSNKFAGYTPKLIAQQISGDNPDQQANYLAARMVTPEIAGARLRLLGSGNIGIEAIREVVNASLQNGKVFEGLVSPKVYAEAQNIATQKIEQAVNSANGALMKMGNSGTNLTVNSYASTSGSPSASNSVTPPAFSGTPAQQKQSMLGWYSKLSPEQQQQWRNSLPTGGSK